MQEADLFSEFVKSNPNQLEDVVTVLKQHERLFQWSSEEVVLDVGCGPGDVTRNALYPWLPKRAKKTVLGIDISPTMKVVGNKKFSCSDVSFETFDIASKDLDIILRDEKFRNGFSKVFSFNALHWVSDLEAAFENMYKLLKPQGQVLLSFPVSRQFQRLYKQMQEKEPWSTILKGVHREIPGYFRNGDPSGELLSIVHEAGFKTLSCTYTMIQDEFANLDVLKKLLGSLDIHFKRIPETLQNRYLEECVEIMRQNTLKELEDGRAIVKESRITAFLEKP